MMRSIPPEGVISIYRRKEISAEGHLCGRISCRIEASGLCVNISLFHLGYESRIHGRHPSSWTINSIMDDVVGNRCPDMEDWWRKSCWGVLISWILVVVATVELGFWQVEGRSVCIPTVHDNRTKFLEASQHFGLQVAKKVLRRPLCSKPEAPLH